MARAAILMLLAGTLARAADPPGTPASHLAMARCRAAEALPAPERRAALEESLRLADVAIESSPDDALAHFAAFCALGRLQRLAGLGLATPGRLRRLRREVDATLALAPDFAAGLTGKGALLLGLPWVLGGDAVQAERLLRRAVEIDPTFLRPRLTLVEALRARHADDEARAEAEQALAIAERQGSFASADAAREHLRALGVSVP